MSRLDEFDIVIRRKGGSLVAGIPQLNLYARGKDVDAALAELDKKKNALAAELEDAGELDSLVIDHQPGMARAMVPAAPSGGLSQFALKSEIVALAVVAVLVIPGTLIGWKVEALVNSLKGIKIGGSEFWTQVQRDLDKMASPESDLPEERKQKLLADIHALAIRWRPFVVEFQSALASPNNTSPGSVPPAEK